MKILHINSYFRTSMFYKNLYEEQVKKNFNIDVFLPVDKDFNKDECDFGEYTTISKNHNKYDRYIFHLKHSKILKDIEEKMNVEEYDVLHAHSLFSNGYIAYKLNENYGIPYIVAVRNTDINVFFKRMIHLRGLGIKILKNAKKIIFISEPYKEQAISEYVPKRYREEFNNKSIVIPNGIDDFWFENRVEKKERSVGNKINLLYVGIINKNKNIETTISACEKLIKEGYEVNYKIVGKIANKKYNDLIKNYSFIEYIKHCSKEELINHYRDSHIFIMPSKHETFGLVYAEAMSQGLPVIYTKGQGFDGQFKEGEVGYSVKYDDIQETIKKIIKIVNNYNKISNNCITKVDRFKWGIISDSYIKQYNIGTH